MGSVIVLSASSTSLFCCTPKLSTQPHVALTLEKLGLKSLLYVRGATADVKKQPSKSKPPDSESRYRAHCGAVQALLFLFYCYLVEPVSTV